MSLCTYLKNCQNSVGFYFLNVQIFGDAVEQRLECTEQRCKMKSTLEPRDQHCEFKVTDLPECNACDRFD